MKHLAYLLIIFLIISSSSTAQNWLRKAGGISNDGALGVTKDANGNLYVTGFFSFSALFEGTNIVSNGLSDVFLMKTNPNGQISWLIKAGGQNQDKGYAVAVNNTGDVYITGFFSEQATFGNQTISSVNGSQDVFLAKYDALGNFLWVKHFGGNDSDIAHDVACDSDGNVYITGQFKGTASIGGNTYSSMIDPVFGVPSYDVFIISYDANGNINWVKQGAAEYEDRGLALAVDANNNLYASGQFSDTISFGQIYNNTSYNSSYLMKIDQGGDELWFKRFTAAFVSINDLEISPNGLLYATGDFSGHLVISGPPYQTFQPDFTKNFFVTALNASGNIQWLQHDGSYNLITAKALSVDNSNNAYVGGEFKCVLNEYSDLSSGEALFNSVGYRDIFMAKFLEDGTRDLVRHFGGPGEDQCFGVSAFDENEPIVCGSFIKNINIPRASNSSFPIITGMNIDTSSSGPDQPYSYCSESSYDYYISSFSSGQSDIFYTNFLDLNRETYDFYDRSGNCSQVIVPAEIDEVTDTITGCDSLEISIITHTGENSLIGPNFNFLWSTGQTDQSIFVNQTGWYSMTASHVDGCRSFTDSIYVIVNQTPADPVISSTYGVVTSSTPLDPCRYRLAIPDTVTNTMLYVDGFGSGEGYYTEWTTPLGTVFGDSIPVTGPGVYSFVAYPPDNPTCDVGTCVQILFFTQTHGDICTSGSFNPQIYFLDSVFEATDTVRVCRGDLFEVYLEDSTYYANGDTSYLPLFVHWSISGTGDADIWPSQPYLGISNTFMIHQQGFEANASGLMTIHASLSLTPSITFGGTSRTFYLQVIEPPQVAPVMSGPTFMCPGDSVYLTLSPTGNENSLWQCSVLWHSSDFDSLLVTQPGTYKVRSTFYEPTMGCDTTIITSFTLAPKPEPTITSQPSSAIICPYDSVLLSTIDAASYTWYGPDGSIISTTNNVYVYAPGIYHCQLTDFDGCVRVTELYQVYEYTTPYLEADDVGQLCAGGDVTITVQTYDASLIVWDPPLAGSGNFVQVSEEGTYSCSVSLCGITTELFIDLELAEVDVNLVLTGNDTICTGEVVNITANPGMAYYYWGGTESGTNVLQVDSSGTYFVQVEDIYGCEFISDTIEIFALPAPNPPLTFDTTVCAGVDLSFNLDSTTTIFWYDDPYAGDPLDTNTLEIDSIMVDASYFASTWDSVCTSQRVPLNILLSPISIPPLVEGDTTLCEGDTLFLQVTNPLSEGDYYWQGPLGFNEVNTEITVIIDTTAQLGAYSVYAADNTCQSAATAVNVLVGGLPNAEIVVDTGSFCMGDSVRLSVLGDIHNINWLPYNLNDTTIWVTEDGMVSIEVESEGGCYGIADTLTLSFNELPEAPLPFDTTVCFGQDVILGLTTDLEVYWYDEALNPIPIDTNYLELDSVVSETIVNVVFKDSVCRSEFTQVSIFINEISSLPLIEGDTLTCENDTMFLAVVNPLQVGTYYWSGPNGFEDEGVEIVIDPFAEVNVGEYLLFVTDGNCESDTATWLVNIAELPEGEILLDGDSVVCEGETVNVYTISGVNNYTWYPGNQHSSNIFVTETSNIFLEAENEYGCKTIVDSIYIEMQAPPPAPADFDTTVCPASTFDVTINSTFDIQWYNNNGLPVYIGNSLNFQNITSNISYSIANLSPIGCISDQAEVNISLVPLPLDPYMNVLSVNVCEGGTIDFNASSVPGATYEWITPVDTISITGTNTLTIDSVGLGHSGTYFVIINLQGCSVSSPLKEVDIIETPKFSNVEVPDPICVNDNVLINADIQGNSIITWQLPNGDVIEAYQLILDNVQTSQTGEYLASYEYLGCESEVLSLPLVVHANPEIDIPDTATCIGAELVLSVSDTFAYALWEGSSNPSYQYTAYDTGYYMVNVYNGFDCGAYDSVKVDWVTCDIIVPNAFTPDGDGYSDYFHFDDTHYIEVNVKIFNRFGRLIYEWSENGGYWDGTNKNNGRLVSEGVYYYVATGKTADKKIREHKGFIELIR